MFFHTICWGLYQYEFYYPSENLDIPSLWAAIYKTDEKVFKPNLNMPPICFIVQGGKRLQPPSTASGYLHKYSFKISSIAHSVAKFQEPVLIFNPWKLFFGWTCLRSKNTIKMLSFLTKMTKISTPIVKKFVKEFILLSVKLCYQIL